MIIKGDLPEQFTDFYDKKAATHRETGLVSDVVFENQKLTKELHQPIISKFKGRTVH